MSVALRLLMMPFIFVVSLAFSVNPKMGIALAVLTILTTVFVHVLHAGFLTVMFCVPFDRLLILGGGALTVTKVLILLTIGAFVLRSLLTRNTGIIASLYNRRTSLWVIAYLMVSLLSLINAHDVGEGTLLLVRRTSVIVLYFLVIGFVRSRKLMNQTINVILVASFFVGMIGMYELISHDQVLSDTQRGEELATTQEGSQRIQGCAGNSNFHAAILAMLLPLALVRALQSKTLIARGLTYGLVLLMVMNIYATNTRLGVLGMILAFAGVFLLSDIRFKYMKLFGAMVGLVVVMGVLALDPSRFSTARYTGDSGSKTVEYRVGWMLMSWEMGRNHPLLGVGVGNYYPEYNEYRRAARDLVPWARIRNHNGIMQNWAEMGAIGLLVFLAMLASLPLELISSTRHQQHDRELKETRIALLIGFFVWVLMIGIIPVLEHEVAWINMGLAMALGNIPPHPAAPTNPRVLAATEVAR